MVWRHLASPHNTGRPIQRPDDIQVSSGIARSTRDVQENRFSHRATGTGDGLETSERDVFKPHALIFSDKVDARELRHGAVVRPKRGELHCLGCGI
jgi:hypothetical protein